MQTDIACEPLRYVGQFVIRAPSQCRGHWVPVLMAIPVYPFELVLNRPVKFRSK
jgi:hypothetical protein